MDTTAVSKESLQIQHMLKTITKPPVFIDLAVQKVCVTRHQGFMQDQFIASHKCFGGHMDVNC